MPIISHYFLQKSDALVTSTLCFSPYSSNSAAIDRVCIAQSQGAAASMRVTALKRITTHTEMKRPVDVVRFVEVSRLSFVKFINITFLENWFISYRFVIGGHKEPFNRRSVVMSRRLEWVQN
jgi:hypothetical protein